MMDQLVARFPEQLREALAIGAKAQIRQSENSIHQVLVAGMGGSGIGANFVAELIREECKVPYLVHKAYQIPAYVGPNTLCICSSYSGNTEETLQSFEQMVQTGAKIVIVASGGKLIAKAKELDLDYIQLPNDWPSPRACLGFSMVQQLAILQHLGLISDRLLGEVKSAADLLDKEQEDIRDKANRIAFFLQDKKPIIYTTDRMEAVAIRFRQQINENAKMLCWHHVFPEMNHNELVGWREQDQQLAVVYLRNRDDLPRNQIRMDITKDLIADKTSSVIELYSKGQSLLERSIFFVHLGDWISVELAELRNVDALEIQVIDHLKRELAKF